MTEDVVIHCESGIEDGDTRRPGAAHRVRSHEERTRDMTAERSAINPVTWSTELGFNQGELVIDSTRTLYISGQTAMSGDGVPMHEDDMAGQIGSSLDNVEAVLAAAEMTLADLVRLTVYTTDVDRLFPHYGVLAARLGAAGAAPATTMLGVTRLAIPGQLVELEATAVR